LKSIGLLREEAVFTETVRMKVGVKEAAKFTTVHLTH
jgi:hypothetical protein